MLVLTDFPTTIKIIVSSTIFTKHLFYMKIFITILKSITLLVFLTPLILALISALLTVIDTVSLLINGSIKVDVLYSNIKLSSSGLIFDLIYRSDVTMSNNLSKYKYIFYRVVTILIIFSLAMAFGEMKNNDIARILGVICLILIPLVAIGKFDSLAKTLATSIENKKLEAELKQKELKDKLNKND